MEGRKEAGRNEGKTVWVKEGEREGRGGSRRYGGRSGRMERGQNGRKTGGVEEGGKEEGKEGGRKKTECNGMEY